MQVKDYVLPEVIPVHGVESRVTVIWDELNPTLPGSVTLRLSTPVTELKAAVARTGVKAGSTA